MDFQPIANVDDEVVELVSQLIQIDSTNYGDDSGPGERQVAEYVQAQLQEVGIDAELYTTTSSKRAGVVARIAGKNPQRPALLAHGHLDVVPAVGDWQHPAFGGEIHDGMLWGRGAVDMKDGNGILLATVRAWQRSGIAPDRDVVLLFLPDEEAGGRHGAHWLVDNRPDIFHNVSDAVGEVGGFSLDVNPQMRMYFIETAEKGIRWMLLKARGDAGHGSMLNDNNAVSELARTLTRIADYQWPVRLTKTNEALVRELSEAHNLELDPYDVPEIIKYLGPLARLIGATFKNSAQPTMLNAGYKVNVDAMSQALRSEDPLAKPVPYVLSGGTDSKAFVRLGINCYGFIPLQLPSSLDFGKLFHGVDERVPVESLKFGARVMDRFLRQA